MNYATLPWPFAPRLLTTFFIRDSPSRSLSSTCNTQEKELESSPSLFYFLFFFLYLFFSSTVSHLPQPFSRFLFTRLCLSFCLSFCLSMCLSTLFRLSRFLANFLFDSISVCPFVYLSRCLSICLPVSFSARLWLSLPPPALSNSLSNPV